MNGRGPVEDALRRVRDAATSLLEKIDTGSRDELAQELGDAIIASYEVLPPLALQTTIVRLQNAGDRLARVSRGA